jgi:hypothetical protein
MEQAKGLKRKMSAKGFFTEQESDVIKLEADSDDGSRMGWVNIGTHAVQLKLDSQGQLSVEVCARTNEGEPLATCTVSKKASVEAGGRDPDDEQLAYEPSQEDVQNVLASNELMADSAKGKSIATIAGEVIESLNFDLIDEAALGGDDLEEKRDLANDEIARQLREMGILEPQGDPGEVPRPRQ